MRATHQKNQKFKLHVSQNLIWSGCRDVFTYTFESCRHTEGAPFPVYLYGAPQRVFTDLSPTALTKHLSEGGIRGLDE